MFIKLKFELNGAYFIAFLAVGAQKTLHITSSGTQDPIKSNLHCEILSVPCIETPFNDERTSVSIKDGFKMKIWKIPQYFPSHSFHPIENVFLPLERRLTDCTLLKRKLFKCVSGTSYSSVQDLRPIKMHALPAQRRAHLPPDPIRCAAAEKIIFPETKPRCLPL